MPSSVVGCACRVPTRTSAPGVGEAQPRLERRGQFAGDPHQRRPPRSTPLYSSAASDVYKRTAPGLVARILSHALNAVLVIANAVSLVLLARGVFLGSSLKPTGLLFAGLALWLVNLGVFALLYWELDGGGPEARADGYRDRYPDLVFPQQQADQQGLAPVMWKPSFYDYVYVSLTSSIAFSPTNAMPYSKWAKLAMGAENVLSFATLAMIVARAVNICLLYTSDAADE